MCSSCGGLVEGFSTRAREHACNTPELQLNWLQLNWLQFNSTRGVTRDTVRRTAADHIVLGCAVGLFGEGRAGLSELRDFTQQFALCSVIVSSSTSTGAVW